jgi:hypothetical protein
MFLLCSFAAFLQRCPSGKLPGMDPQIPGCLHPAPHVAVPGDFVPAMASVNIRNIAPVDACRFDTGAATR